MTKPFSVLSKTALTILFACSATPAFAQHGGGGGHMGGGGGFHGGGGGGFHSGGGGSGFHGGGGGARGGSYAPPVAGYGAPRGSAPPQMRSGGGFVPRPGNTFSRPGNTFGGGNQRFGNSVSAPAAHAAPTAPADGRWHSFGNSAGNRGPSAAPTETGSANAGGWHVPSGNRAPGSTGAVRSFSGQGGEVWENGAAPRNVVSRSQSLSSIHNSATSSLAANSGLGSSASLFSSSRFNSGSSLAGSRLSTNRGFSTGVNTTSSFQQLRGFNRFGPSHQGWRRGWGGGCWNCGFGFGGWGWGNGWGWGFGWGWGWPWLGFWGWNPYWVDPWWGWSSPGYGYYGYPSNTYIYNYSGSGNYAPDDNSTPPPPEYQSPDNSSDENNNIDGNWVTPNGPSPAVTPNSTALAVPVLIYMKNGAVFSVRDYWMSDSEFHYVLMNGDQKTVDLDLVDLARTNSENAKSGVKFIFKSSPSAPPPDENFAPPAKPNSSQPTLAPLPEART